MGADPDVEGADNVGWPPPGCSTGWIPGEPGWVGSEETGVRMSVVAGPLGAVSKTGIVGLLTTVGNDEVGDGVPREGT